MSFGAVVALIAVYETWGARLARLFHGGSVVRRGAGLLSAAVAVTTVIATFGTEPFAIHHFHHFVAVLAAGQCDRRADFGDVDIAVGPRACLLMPFGLEQLALVPMGWGIDATVWVAQWVAGLPGNVWSTPRLPMYGLVLIALGGLVAVPVARALAGLGTGRRSRPASRRCC